MPHLLSDNLQATASQAVRILAYSWLFRMESIVIRRWSAPARFQVDGSIWYRGMFWVIVTGHREDTDEERVEVEQMSPSRLPADAR